ncbi:hypothetical protein ACI6PS_03490 [Flavobacterium sp. PLA-1-15]|uniref:hypothetical protein n=1 Tax=Flavobacterium sp. PLA-1-15 TaxID=3380533 RepID=UPI003B771F60
MRTNKNNTLHPNVFQIASNLLGVETRSQKELKETVAIQIAIQPDVSDKLAAVYPAIIEEAFSGTMDNYRKYVALKNFQVSEENGLIQEWNKTVRKFKKENLAALTEVQLQFSKQFPKTHKSLDPTTYNAKVDDFVKEYGMLVQKKKMLTIKPTAELVFQNMLYIYNQQLMKRNERYIKSHIITKTPIEAFKINAWKLTQLKRNGIQSLNLCRKTILNHRKRFEEFGILQDYHFKGSKMAVEVQINPEILVLKDIYNQKLMRAENQPVTPLSGKIVPNENEKFTRTFIKEEEMNEKVENSSLDKEFPPVTPFIFSLTGTPTSNMQVQTTGAAADVKVSQTPSDFALATIIPDSELATRLQNREFVNYKPIDIRFLHRLAYNGTLSREEFYDVAMIDFFKSLQKNIYKTQAEIYFGSWFNAIKFFRKQRWQLFNGDCFQPQHIFEEITQYRWRIQWARNWFAKHPTFNPLYPNMYLDVTRKNSKEVGFEYTKVKWKMQQDDNDKYDKLLKKQEADAKRRGILINHNKKMQMAINRFFKDKITLTSLYDYVEKNLPPEYLQRLPDLIQTKALAINKQTVEVKYNLGDFL